MADPLREPLEPYEPTTTFDSHEDYDWDYEEERAGSRPMNILWGRVAILGALLVAFFLLGRMTAGGGVPESELTEARDRVTQLEDENAQLTTELAAAEQQRDDLQAQLDAAAISDTSEGTATEGDTAGDSTETIEVQTYVVKAGDTLTTIAEEFYGDASLDDYLAEFNNITDPTALSVGQELQIPKDPPS